MKTKKVRYTILEEESFVDFESYEQLSYEEGDTHVLLYVGDKAVGKIRVWADRENENREYVCINYEVVYLDSMSLREVVS